MLHCGVQRDGHRPFKASSVLATAMEGQKVGSQAQGWLASGSCYPSFASWAWVSSTDCSFQLPEQVCFHFPVSPHPPSSASSGPLLHLFLPASPWLSLFSFLFRAPSQTLLLLSNAACAVSESLRLGTADGNEGQFLWCRSSGGWGEGGASGHW